MKWRCCFPQVRPGRYHHPTRAARAGTPVRFRFCIRRPTMQIDSVGRFVILSRVLIRCPRVAFTTFVQSPYVPLPKYVLVSGLSQKINRGIAAGRQQALVKPMQINTNPNVQAQGLRGKNGPLANGSAKTKPTTINTTPNNLASSGDAGGLSDVVGSARRKITPNTMHNRYKTAINKQ
jgi:hypothetical protein